MFKTFFLFFFSILTVIDACNKTSRYDFTLERNINGTESLKTQGFYYYIDNVTNRITYIILYQNGIVYGPVVSTKNLSEVINNLSSEGINNQKRKLVYSWGIYNVAGEELNLETWLSTDGGPYPTYIHRAKILNDTTFTIVKSMYSDGYGSRNENDNYHFYYLKSKPDSLNPYIK